MGRSFYGKRLCNYSRGALEMDKTMWTQRWSAELCQNRLPLGSRTDKANTGFWGPHGVSPSNRSKSELIMDRGARLPSSVARNTNSPGNSGTSIGAQPGEHTIVSRAIDKAGRVQPAADDPRIAQKHTIGKAMGRSLDEYRFPGEGEDAFCLACEAGNQHHGSGGSWIPNPAQR